MTGAFNLFMVYQFVRRLATPFYKWKAYELGIIDSEGNVLIPRKELKTREEKQAFGLFDVLLLNIKKIIHAVPGGNSRLASYAAALFLIREMKDLDSREMLDEEINRLTTLFEEEYMHFLVEEAPTNSAGGGHIDGIGVGPRGEPGVKKRRKKPYKDFVTDDD